MATGYIKTSGGLVLPASASASVTDSISDLKKRIARAVGGQEDNEVLQLSYDAIREVVDDINIRHHFDFTTAVAADIDLVADTIEYTLPTDFFGMRSVQLVRATGGDDDGIVRNLEWWDWEQHNQFVEDQRSEGTPNRYTIRDAHTNAKIIVYPIPMASDATNYDIRITYLKPISVPADSPTVTISAPRQLTAVLLAYGRYHVIKMRYPEQDSRWKHEYGLYLDRLNAFSGNQQENVGGSRIMRVDNAGPMYRRYGGFLRRT